MAERSGAKAAAICGDLPEPLRSGLACKQLPALDGLRAVAAFLVVFYHSASQFVPGGLGVLAFFVLSGFLITWLLLEEQDVHGGVSIKLFYARRTLRIFPAFYGYWVVLAAWTAYRHRIVWAQALCSFFYVNDYYQAIHGDPNTAFSHTWSLGVEEQFYLLWPVSFLFLQRFPRRQAVRILLGAIAAVWIYRCALQFGIGVDQGYIYEAFDTRTDHLLCGCVLAFALRCGAFPGLWRQLCGSRMFSLGMVAALIGSVCLEVLYGQGYRDAIGFVANPVLVALLIPQAIAFRSWWAWSWLNWSWIRYLGRISYSVYLYQQVTPTLASKIFPHSHPAFVAANAVAVILAATCSYYVVERPFLKLKARFTRKTGGEEAKPRFFVAAQK